MQKYHLNGRASEVNKSKSILLIFNMLSRCTPKFWAIGSWLEYANAHLPYVRHLRSFRQLLQWIICKLVYCRFLYIKVTFLLHNLIFPQVLVVLSALKVEHTTWFHLCYSIKNLGMMPSQTPKNPILKNKDAIIVFSENPQILRY